MLQRLGNAKKQRIVKIIITIIIILHHMQLGLGA